MAHAGKDTGGSQFFITHSPQPHLDGVHTVFGKVVQGRDGVDKIKAVPTRNQGGAFLNLPTTPVVIQSATLLP